MTTIRTPNRVIASILLIQAFVLAISAAIFAMGEPETRVYGIAIKGYDPVAYFTENRAVKGNSDHTFNWNEATWHFSNAENRDLFVANPKKYAPTRGGF